MAALCLHVFPHRYIADQWACCLFEAAVHHSRWIIHVLWRKGTERNRPHKAKLIKVAGLNVWLCLFQEGRKERSAVIPFLILHLHHSWPLLPPTLASLIPLSSFGFLRKITSWLLTLIFQYLSEYDRLYFVSPTPLFCPYFHPHTSLFSCPILLVSFAYRYPDSPAFTMWQERSRVVVGGVKNKNKSGSKWGRFARLSGCLPVSPCESRDTYTSMNLRWGKVSLRPDICHSRSAFDALGQRFRLTERGSDLILGDRQKRGVWASSWPLQLSHFTVRVSSVKLLTQQKNMNIFECW